MQQVTNRSRLLCTAKAGALLHSGSAMPGEAFLLQMPNGSLLPVLSFDFENGIYAIDGGSVPDHDAFSFSRASAGSYVDAQGQIQFAAINEPRFDYATGRRGLLVEQSSTNRMLHSDDLGQSVWETQNASIVVDHDVAPDGQVVMDLLREDHAHAFHRVRQTGITFSAATTYTNSVFAKAQGRRYFDMRQNVDGVYVNLACFDVQDGAVVRTSAGVTAAVDDAGNGVFRCSATYTTGASPLNDVFFVLNDAETTTDTIQSYQGDGVSGVLFWGFQVEDTPFATSYIPTSGAQVTRARDDTTTVLGDYYNPSQGTFLIKTHLSYTDNDAFTEQRILRSQIDSSNFFEFRLSTNTAQVGAIELRTNLSGNTTGQVTVDPVLTPGRNRSLVAAFSYDGTHVRCAANGSVDSVSKGFADYSGQDVELFNFLHGAATTTELLYFDDAMSSAELASITS